MHRERGEVEKLHNNTSSQKSFEFDLKDWVFLLENRISSTWGKMVGFMSTLIVILVAITLYSQERLTGADTVWFFIAFLMIFLIFLAFLLRYRGFNILDRLNSERQCYLRLQREIIEGKLKDSEEIRKRFIALTKRFEGK